MSSITLVIAILSISTCILLSIVAYNRATRWIAAVIIPALCVAAYLGWNSAEDLKGYATTKIYEDDALFLGSVAAPPKFIYVWVQPLNTDETILMSVPFSESFAVRMAQANKDLCEGKPQGVKGQGKKSNREDAKEADEFLDGNGPVTLEVYDFNLRIRPTK